MVLVFLSKDPGAAKWAWSPGRGCGYSYCSSVVMLSRQTVRGWFGRLVLASLCYYHNLYHHNYLWIMWLSFQPYWGLFCSTSYSQPCLPGWYCPNGCVPDHQSHVHSVVMMKMACGGNWPHSYVCCPPPGSGSLGLWQVRSPWFSWWWRWRGS